MDGECPIPSTHDKFTEAHYFLSRMTAEYHQPAEFRWTVGAASAGPDGRFELRLSKGGIPQDYITDDGQLDLKLVAWSENREVHSFVSVRADSAAGEPVWVDPTAARGLASDKAVSNRVNVSLELSQPPTAATGDPAPKPGCSYWLVGTYDIWSQIGDGLSYNSRQTNWMYDASSHTVTVGAAISSGGGWTSSGTTSTTTGVTFTWAASSSDRYFDVQIRYGNYANNCGAPNSFRAIYPTGGYRTRLISYDPAWTYCVQVSAGTWTRSTQGGSSYSLSGGVLAAGVIGINLSMNTSYASTRTLSYNQTVSRHLCGSNNTPSLAARIAGKA